MREITRFRRCRVSYLKALQATQSTTLPSNQENSGLHNSGVGTSYHQRLPLGCGCMASQAGPMSRLPRQYHLAHGQTKSCMVQSITCRLCGSQITPCILWHLLVVLRSDKQLRLQDHSCIQLPQVPLWWTIHHPNRLNIQPYYPHVSW